MTFVLRSYQREWNEAIAKDRAAGFSRLLVDAPGGVGKSTVFAALAADEWNLRQGRTLVLENRDNLVRQTADRIRAETGLECDIEMAGMRASPYAPIVVASVATLGRVNRLAGFAPDHFSLVVPDEAHHSLAPLFVRVMNYFHYGAESLAEGWIAPKDGTYAPKATIVGFTATPDIGTSKNLGTLYQKLSVSYSYLNAIEDGWLVGLREENIPVKVDTRKFRVKRTGQGMDFSPEDEAAAIIPIIEELAEQIVKLASDKKTMAFLPSLECARLLSEALNRRGLRALYVSGVCLDKDEKTDEFHAATPGIVLCLCALYVEGADFPTCDCVAWLRATISKAFYKQGIYRVTRTLPGVVSDAMSADERRAAIASSPKPNGLVISPFFISDRIDICEIYDLYATRDASGRVPRKKPDFTKPAEVRDFIAALEKAADKHRNKQSRTINPVSFALSVGDKALTGYVPQNAADAAPPSREVLDYLLEKGISTVDVKTAGQANKLVDRLRERERLGLATPAQLVQLTLHLHWPEEKAALMSAKQAGVMVWKRIGYKAPTSSAPKESAPTG